MNLLTRIENKLKRIAWKPALSGGERLIVHIGQHKAMTAYFNKVLYQLCVDFDWEYRKFFGEADYLAGLPECLRTDKITVVCCYNFFPDPEVIGRPFRGSNIIRDPRDLLVSGYKYHLWCEEPWANRPMPAELHQRLHLTGRFPQISADDLAGMSYRDLLNRVDQTQGYMLELDFRTKHFDAMFRWSYNYPNILELKYEDVFNREEEHFARLFLHYGFSEAMVKHGLRHVRDFSFRNLQKKGSAGAGRHASTGRTAQWKEKLPAPVIEAFHQRYGDRLHKLGYE